MKWGRCNCLPFLGLFDSKGYDAVFISHYHGDHMGLAYDVYKHHLASHARYHRRFASPFCPIPSLLHLRLAVYSSQTWFVLICLLDVFVVINILPSETNHVSFHSSNVRNFKLAYRREEAQ